MKLGRVDQWAFWAMVSLGVGLVGLTLASAAGVFISKNPAQRFEDELRDYFGGNSKTFQAQGVLIDEREFRVTVLNPDETKFTRQPSPDSSVGANVNLNQDCLQAWQIMNIALSALPDGVDPGYTDYMRWKWPVTVEWGWTQAGTLETKLNHHTFTAEQIKLGVSQCIQS